MDVTITAIHRLPDWEPSPTGAVGLARFNYRIKGLLYGKHAVLGWSPYKGARVWLQPSAKGQALKSQITLENDVAAAMLKRAKTAFEALGGEYPNGGETIPYPGPDATPGPEVSAAVDLVRQIEQRDAA